MVRINYKYWLCQLIGWGGWALLNLFFVYLFISDVYLKPAEKGHIFFMSLAIESVIFIISTHLLRFTLKKLNWMQLPVRTVIMVFVLGVSFTGLLSYYGSKLIATSTGNSLVQYEKRENLAKAISLERNLGLEGTTYYLSNESDSINSRHIIAIKKTGWFRNDKGNWTFYTHE